MDRRRLTSFAHTQRIGLKNVETILKKQADVMESCARVVITVDEAGNIVSMDRKPDFAYTGNYLVVIGPAKLGHQSLPKVVRLEISFGRSVPYNFFWHRGSKTQGTQPRFYIPLDDEMLHALLPTLFQEIEKTVDENIIPRKVISKKITKNGQARVFLTGSFITVKEEEAFLCYALLFSDRESRKNEFYRSVAQNISRLVIDLKRLSFTEKQARKSKSLMRVKEIIHGNYTEEQFETILECMGKPGTKARRIVESLVSVLSIRFRTKLEGYEQLFRELRTKYHLTDHSLHKMRKLRVSSHPKRDNRRKQHASGCIRIEVYPSREARDAHEERNRFLPKSNPGEDRGEVIDRYIADF